MAAAKHWNCPASTTKQQRARPPKIVTVYVRMRGNRGTKPIGKMCLRCGVLWPANNAASAEDAIAA
jgi:hypothetical protein